MDDENKLTELTVEDTEDEIIKKILQKTKELGCSKCAIWDFFAQTQGKRAMCENCFNENFFLIETYKN